jgi:hypothetical protein
LRARLYLAAALVLVAGLSAAAVIYFTAGENEPRGGSYVVANGVAYWVPAQASKTYVRDLRRFGGKAAVLFDELSEWFADLWRGRALAATVACISVATAGALFLFGRYRL